VVGALGVWGYMIQWAGSTAGTGPSSKSEPRHTAQPVKRGRHISTGRRPWPGPLTGSAGGGRAGRAGRGRVGNEPPGRTEGPQACWHARDARTASTRRREGARKRTGDPGDDVAGVPAWGGAWQAGRRAGLSRSRGTGWGPGAWKTATVARDSSAGRGAAERRRHPTYRSALKAEIPRP